MVHSCTVCGGPLPPANPLAKDVITRDICPACVCAQGQRELLDAIDAPVLLMQGNPRQVVSANEKALELFGKTLAEVERHRGGEVFDCTHSYTEAGCGKDVNCEHCSIKNAIVDTFTTNQSHHQISAPLQIVKPAGTKGYRLEITTQKLDDLALVRIDRFQKTE